MKIEAYLPRLRKELREVVIRLDQYADITFPLAPDERGCIVPEALVSLLRVLSDRYPPPEEEQPPCCRECGEPVGRRSSSHLCRRCYSRLWHRQQKSQQQPKTCQKCGAQLGVKNRSGLCKPCYQRNYQRTYYQRNYAQNTEPAPPAQTQRGA